MNELLWLRIMVIIHSVKGIRSKKAIRFRQWATKMLKEYITKGFVLNDEMLKNGKPFGSEQR